jgi:1,4-alpha-glucan branching enzyme
MLEKTYIKSRKVWKVKFILPKEECPPGLDIESINLCGDFNEWEPSAMPMKLNKGIYSAWIELAPGQDYQFRYLINGNVWCNDWQADKYVPNMFGEDNCVVHLPVTDHQDA